MACPAIITGDQFLSRVLTHIDCQASILGSYGFQALGEPGSLASNVMVGLLTLFVALIGLRFLFGPGPGPRDLVYDALKVGLVLTMAFSWPAFRTVIHDVVVNGPAEVAAAISPDELTGPSTQLLPRLQAADQQIVELTSTGAGRQTGQILEGSQAGAGFSGSGLQDDTALGYSRLAYLSGILGPFALLRILAGLLLAIAPLAAGLLLFEATRGLFAGWLRGLVLSMLGILGVTMVLALQLSVIEPWLADALRVRALGYGIPSAPTELLALTIAFAIVQFAIIWLLAKVAFNRGWLSQWAASNAPMLAQSDSGREPTLAGPALPHTTTDRVQRISDNVERVIRREQHSSEQSRMAYRGLLTEQASQEASSSDNVGTRKQDTPPLGSSYRRSYRRSMGTTRREDKR